MMNPRSGKTTFTLDEGVIGENRLQCGSLEYRITRFPAIPNPDTGARIGAIIENMDAPGSSFSALYLPSSGWVYIAPPGSPMEAVEKAARITKENPCAYQAPYPFPHPENITEVVRNLHDLELSMRKGEIPMTKIAIGTVQQEWWDALKNGAVVNPTKGLAGKAQKYALRYRESFHAMKRRAETAGYCFVEVPGPRGGVGNWKLQ